MTAAVPPMAVLLQLLLLAAAGAEFSPPRTVQECVAAPQRAQLPEDTRHVLHGSTSPLLDADVVDNYRMYWAEKQPACVVQMTLQQNVRALSQFLETSALSLSVSVHTQPGRSTVALPHQLQTFGTVLVESVVVDLEHRHVSVELSIAGLRLDTPLQQYLGHGPSALRIPSLRVRITALEQLVDRPGGGVGVQLTELAVRISVHEPPHFLGHRDSTLGPVYGAVEYLLEQQFNNTLRTLERDYMDALALTLRDNANTAIQDWDIGFLQPRALLQMVEFSKLSEKIQRGEWGQ